jgi:hypothetical protein
MAVMPHDMSPHLFEASSREDLPLSVHPEMIADTLPALGLVVIVNLFDRVVLIGAETITMQHDQSNFSHFLVIRYFTVRDAALLYVEQGGLKILK